MDRGFYTTKWDVNGQEVKSARKAHQRGNGSYVRGGRMWVVPRNAGGEKNDHHPTSIDHFDVDIYIHDDRAADHQHLAPRAVLNALVGGLGSDYATSGVVTNGSDEWAAVSTNSGSTSKEAVVYVYKWEAGNFLRQATVPLPDAGMVDTPAENDTPITSAHLTGSSDPDFAVTSAGGSAYLMSVISDVSGTWVAVPFDVNGQQQDAVPSATVEGQVVHAQMNNWVPDCAQGTEADIYYRYSAGGFVQSQGGTPQPPATSAAAASPFQQPKGPGPRPGSW